MGFGEAVSVCFSKYATFSGRASRSEYWFWVLFTTLGSLVFEVVDAGIGTSIGILSGLFTLATIVPSFAVWVRRMHDTDRSAWWLLLCLVPVLGWIALLVFACTRGTDGPNRFGYLLPNFRRRMA